MTVAEDWVHNRGQEDRPKCLSCRVYWPKSFCPWICCLTWIWKYSSEWTGWAFHTTDQFQGFWESWLAWIVSEWRVKAILRRLLCGLWLLKMTLQMICSSDGHDRRHTVLQLNWSWETMQDHSFLGRCGCSFIYRSFKMHWGFQKIILKIEVQLFYNVNFYCTAKWLQVYTHIYILFIFSSIMIYVLNCYEPTLQMVTTAMKLKDSCSLEEKLWPT